MSIRERSIQQGGDAWLAARRGMVTASQFGAVVTPKARATANAARTTYLCELVTERLTGRAVDHYVTGAMQRGTDAEPKARAWYEITRGVEVRQTGLIVREETWGRVGGSPDGLVGDDGGIEIKCPLPVNLVRACLYNDISDYLPQVQGLLWITGRAWWDVVLWGPEPGLPAYVERVFPDAPLHAAFAEHIPAFAREVDAAEKTLRAAGAGVSDADMAGAIEAALDPTADW
jgi:hypothetical protein